MLVQTIIEKILVDLTKLSRNQCALKRHLSRQGHHQ